MAEKILVTSVHQSHPSILIIGKHQSGYSNEMLWDCEFETRRHSVLPQPS